jgi:hypothetical protein
MKEDGCMTAILKVEDGNVAIIIRTGYALIVIKRALAEEGHLKTIMIMKL